MFNNIGISCILIAFFYFRDSIIILQLDKIKLIIDKFIKTNKMIFS